MNGIEYINIDVINVVKEQIIFLQSTMPWEVKKINKYWLKCFKLVLRYWETTPYHNAFCQVVKIEVILEQFKKKLVRRHNYLVYGSFGFCATTYKVLKQPALSSIFPMCSSTYLLKRVVGSVSFGGQLLSGSCLLNM